MPTNSPDHRSGARSLWGRLKSALAPAPASAAPDAEASYAAGLEAEDRKDNEQALTHYRAAVALRPQESRFHYAVAAILKRLSRQREAAAAYREAVALAPDDAHLRADLGGLLIAMGELEEAREHLERSRQLAPELAEARHNLGLLHHQLGEVDVAIAEISVAARLAPDNLDIRTTLLFILNYSARHAPTEILAEHRRLGAQLVQPVAAPAPDPAWPRRLRIGYVSPDFRSHVVACFMLPVFARHDRQRFEVVGYYSYPKSDETTAQMRAMADNWLDCAHLSDAELAAQIRADRVDILVDLAGLTAHQRLRCFALRPAPVQVTYLGYPNTTGLSAFDYRITDAKADPAGEADRLNVERLARLPRSFLCYRPGPDVHEPGPTPALREGVVTFGCLNNFQKQSDAFFDAAARVLAAVPKSRLLLKARSLGNAAAARRARERFAARGIAAERLILMGWEATPEDHLAIYQRIDIALDSFPYNGTTTTCEALWMGVPVVTLAGDRHAGRVGASLLETVGLPELVGSDVDDYVRIAAGLAGDLPRLSALRAGMRDRLRASPLRDETGFVRDLEACYLSIWEEKLKASPPPPSMDALAKLWDECQASGEHTAFVDAAGRALAAGLASSRLYFMLGCTMEDLARPQDAVAMYQKALELDPANAKAANNQGVVQEALGDFDGAAASYDRALLADPKLANALYNRANLSRRRGRLEAAEADLRAAVALDPQRADWIGALADIHLLRWRLDEAEAGQRAALAIEPASPHAHFGLGNVLMMLGRVDEAEVSFRRAVDFQPDFAEAHGNLLFCMHYRHGADADAMHAEHRAWAERHAEGLQPRGGHPAISRTPGRRLNIGYFSANFHRHSVASFFESLLAAHDRDAVRVFCYSNVDHPDEVTARLRGLSDEWRDLRGVQVDAAARLIREDRIDVLVDLAGHTGGGRPLLFARKPAPVQISWLGYPNTTGLAQMDYRLTDAVADPAGAADRHHSEKLLRLPKGFLCFRPEDDSPEPGEAPSLRAGRITFGCFNNLAKVTPELVALWCRLLAAVPNSRLMLKAHALGSRSARERLLGEFAAGGIGADRVMLLGPEDSAAGHLARYREVDIALDTYPYNGTTTTCEALWMGVPVVTLAGPTHVSRVGASILKQVGLEQLVAATPEDYIARAADLAKDAARLRSGMRARLRESPLLDSAGFARAVEAAYRTAWDTWMGASVATRAAAPEVAGAEPLRLHVGGKEVKPGWKILNIQPGPDVDYVGNCTELGQFDDGSVQEIYASHVLEHLGYKAQLPRALEEFHRVLRPDGKLLISVPDFETLCRLFLEPGATLTERFSIMRMAFGGQMDEHDFHYVGLSFQILAKYLGNAGFSSVERVQGFGLFQDGSVLEWHGEAISLNVVAYK